MFAMKKTKIVSSLTSLSLIFCSIAFGKTLQAPEEKKNVLNDSETFKALKYRNIGPAWGGRVSRSCGVPGNPNVFYMATASGGVWKSEDGGLNWKSIFDDQPISSIGSIAIAPSDAN